MIMSNVQPHHESKARILDAALRVIRTKGYSATTIDDVCATAGLTKGSFFHHFKSKDELALAATAHFAAMADGLFAAAPYRTLSDPRDRVIGYVKFRKSILTGDLPEFTCLLGTLVQEAYETHPAIREACDKYISAHAALVEQDIAAAKRICAPKAKWSPASLALFTQAALQGAFTLAKAKHGPQIAAECIDHLQRYIETQLPPTKT
jgi:TetR/AcrR family transcriptional repressor of nem operon